MPPRRKTLNRPLTTAERMLVAVGPSTATLARRGLSSQRAVKAEKDWERWNERYGFSWRVNAGYPTLSDRRRLDAGEEPASGAPPPPGLDLP